MAAHPNPLLDSTASLSGITVCHTRDEDVDVHGARGNGSGHVMNTPTGERGWLGNPFKLENYGDSRREVIARYVPAFYGRLSSDESFREAVRGLDGKRVGCWCRHSDEDEPLCHLDVVDHFLRGGRLYVREFLTHDLGAIPEDGEVVMLE